MVRLPRRIFIASCVGLLAAGGAPPDATPARPRQIPGPADALPQAQETPGLLETQLTVAVDREGSRRRFRATALRVEGDVVTILTAAHCISDADKGWPVALLFGGGVVVEGVVESASGTRSIAPTSPRRSPVPTTPWPGSGSGSAARTGPPPQRRRRSGRSGPSPPCRPSSTRARRPAGRRPDDRRPRGRACRPRREPLQPPLAGVGARLPADPRRLRRGRRGRPPRPQRPAPPDPDRRHRRPRRPRRWGLLDLPRPALGGRSGEASPAPGPDPGCWTVGRAISAGRRLPARSAASGRPGPGSARWWRRRCSHAGRTLRAPARGRTVPARRGRTPGRGRGAGTLP